MKIDKPLKFIDLFSGCGGLSNGFEQAGFIPLLGIDNDKDSIESFKSNHIGAKAILANIEDITSEEIINQVNSEIDIIIGGPPCQGFSIAGKRMIEDPRNSLYKYFVKIVSEIKPRAFLMENVPNLGSIAKGEVKKQITEDFSKLGYKVSSSILVSSDYGVPQKRKRLVFIGLLSDSFVFPEKKITTPVTSFEALSDLPEESLDDGTPYISVPQNKYQEEIRVGSKGIYNHQITVHNDKTIEIINLVPDGGNYKDLPEDLRGTRKMHIAWTRLNSNMPSFTIDTGHRHHFHYKWNRVPTVRESARIQSFSDKFIFKGSKTSQYRQVGNAVPPLMAKAIAEKLKQYL